MPFRILRLKRVVERNHDCKAEHAGSRVIVEPKPDGSIWRGSVELFTVTGRADSDRCYAWIEYNGDQTIYVTRLRIGSVTSAQQAVRTVIAVRSIQDRVAEK
jgi:hypothetical protein